MPSVSSESSHLSFRPQELFKKLTELHKRSLDKLQCARLENDKAAIQQIIDLLVDSDGTASNIDTASMGEAVKLLGNLGALKVLHEQRGEQYQELCSALETFLAYLPSRLSDWQKVEEMATALMEAKRALARPDDEIANVKILQDHAGLRGLVEKVIEYGEVGAFVDGDSKDILSRQLLQASRRCGSVTAEPGTPTLRADKFLSDTRAQAWGLLNDIVKHKQTTVDKQLSTHAEELALIAKGMDQGLSWKAPLLEKPEDELTWAVLVKCAKERLLENVEKGNVLQLKYKALSEVGALRHESWLIM